MVDEKRCKGGCYKGGGTAYDYLERMTQSRVHGANFIGRVDSSYAPPTGAMLGPAGTTVN